MPGGCRYCILTDDPDIHGSNECTDVMRYASCTSDADKYRGSDCEEAFPHPTFARLADIGDGAAQRLCVAGDREFQCTYTVRRIPDSEICRLGEEQQNCMCERGAGDASCRPVASALASFIAPVAASAESASLLIGAMIAATVVVVVMGLSATWRRRVPAVRTHQGFDILTNSDGAATTFEDSAERSGSLGDDAEATESADQCVDFARRVECQVVSSKDAANRPGKRALV